MRRGARGRKRAGRSGETWETPCIPNGRLKWFYLTNLPSCVRRAKRAGCGQMRSQNICFGHVLFAVRQSQQRGDAAVAGEEQLGRCVSLQRQYCRLYLYSGILLRGDIPSPSSSRWPYFRGSADACFMSCYATCACGKNPWCRPPAALPGQACGGVLRAAARSAPARLATPRSTIKFWPVYAQNIRICIEEETTHHHAQYTTQANHRIYRLASGTNSAESPCGVAALWCSKLKAPHRGTSLGSCAGVSNNFIQAM